MIRERRESRGAWVVEIVYVGAKMKSICLTDRFTSREDARLFKTQLLLELKSNTLRKAVTITNDKFGGMFSQRSQQSRTLNRLDKPAIADTFVVPVGFQKRMNGQKKLFEHTVGQKAS